MLAIDHPLVLVRDLEATAARYRALGFHTAPVGQHPWGTSTCLITFERSALELMGVYDETLLDSHAVGSFRFGRYMAEALAEREGVSLVALYSEDAPGDRAMAEARGLAAQGRVDFRRRVKVPGRDWDEAVVTLEILVDKLLPRASNFLCQQHRPELIWVKEWMQHPNGALGFAGITYAAREPGPLVRRLRALFGDAAVRPTTIGHEAVTGRGVITVVRPGVWAREIGVTAEPDVGYEAACIGIDIRVGDLSVLGPLLGAAGINATMHRGGIAIRDFRGFGNVLLRFVSRELPG
jgi:hypothetical protein